jgi:hypothetical protein
MLGLRTLKCEDGFLRNLGAITVVMNIADTIDGARRAFEIAGRGCLVRIGEDEPFPKSPQRAINREWERVCWKDKSRRPC